MQCIDSKHYMNKEESYIKNRILELANISYMKNICTYSDFLNLNEINIFNTITSLLPPVDYELTGGNIYAERKILVFKPKDICYQEVLPISVIKVAPTNSKYADNLSHRDFLGAILNLGIDRSKIGDIFVIENIAYIYVINKIAEFVVTNLYKVKHTNITCSIMDQGIEGIQPNLIEITGTISNIRLDSLIALAFKQSRNSIISYIEQKKVFVNGKLITSNGYAIKDNDIISVRGLGRFIFNKKLSITKKGKNLVSVYLYL